MKLSISALLFTLLLFNCFVLLVVGKDCSNITKKKKCTNKCKWKKIEPKGKRCITKCKKIKNPEVCGETVGCKFNNNKRKCKRKQQPPPLCTQQTITANKFIAEEIVNDQQEDSFFGHAVAIVDNMIAVGSFGAEKPYPNKGAVYVYKRDESGSWKLLNKIEGDEGDYLGFSVAMSANTIVAGASLANDNKGYVVVVDTVISDFIRLEDVGGSSNSQFGTSVGISEDGIVIVVGSVSGGLFFYEKDGSGTWKEVQNVENESPILFGQQQSVAIDNDFVVTTARNGNIVAGGKDECIVFIYVRNSEGLWVDFEVESLGDFELKGYDPQVSLSGNTIAVGLKNGFNSNGVQTGVVFILTAKVDNNVLTWEKTQTIFPPEDVDDAEFGSNVAVSGNNMVVGYNKEGAAYFYTRNNKGKWKVYKKVISESGGFYTFRSVSASGTTAVFGEGFVDEFTGSVDVVECF